MLGLTIFSTASFAAVFVTVIGGLIYWSNPTRAVNRVVFTCSLNWAVWLTCLHVAIYMSGGLPWVRITCAAGAFLPMHLWVVNETIAGNWRSGGRFPARLVGWAVVSTLLAAICFTQYFVASRSILHLEVLPPNAPHRSYGWGYFAYVVVDAILYLSVLGFTFSNLKKLTGARRLELSIWLIGGCAVTLAILGTMVLSFTTAHSFVPRIMQPLFVLAFYGGTAYSITAYRIFDAYQILRLGLSKFLLFLVAGIASYAVFFLTTQVVSAPISLLFTIATALLCTSLLKGWLDRRFEFYPQDIAARQAAYLVAHNETRADNMEVPSSTSCAAGAGPTRRSSSPAPGGRSGAATRI